MGDISSIIAERAPVSQINNYCQNFPSKILLFGEYTVMKGSRGIALPFRNFNASFYKAESAGDVKSSFRLDEFYNYLQGSNILSKSMDLQLFKEDIESGIYLKSDIPNGYGIGSSGALCAAIYARYAKNFQRKESYNSEELNTLKDIMALMESFYHGTSSGLDCLISLVDQPILIKDRNIYEITEYPDLSSIGNFYLFDSGMSRKTATFVYSFLEKYDTDERFKNAIEEKVEIINSVIDNLFDSNRTDFENNIYDLSRFQYNFFSEMIPPHVKEIWFKGLETKEYFFKLCGAGGGGYFLVFSPNNSLDAKETFVKIN
ncbi:MAG: mevalonate kinase [Pseudomonadota bacterium]